MKAVFMTELGGRLMEVERRDIRPRMDYYRAVREPIALGILNDDGLPPPNVQTKQEHWICCSKPVTDRDFAVFLLKGIE